MEKCQVDIVNIRRSAKKRIEILEAHPEPSFLTTDYLSAARDEVRERGLTGRETYTIAEALIDRVTEECKSGAIVDRYQQ